MLSAAWRVSLVSVIVKDFVHFFPFSSMDNFSNQFALGTTLQAKASSMYQLYSFKKKPPDLPPINVVGSLALQMKKFKTKILF